MTKLRYDPQCELQFVQSYSRQLPWQLGCSFERFCLEQRHRLLSKYDVSIEARGCRWKVKKAGNISDRQFIEPVVWSVLVSMMTISSTWRSTLITGDFTSFPLLFEIVASSPDSRKNIPETHKPKFVGLFQTHFDFSCVSESEIRRWFKRYKRVWMESGNEKARFPDSIRLRRYLLGEVWAKNAPPLLI